MEDILEYSTKTELPRFKAQDSLDDETEDEEVKLNCIGGLRGYQDSDLSSDSEEEDDDDEEKGDELEMEDRNSIDDGVVEFSCGRMPTSCLGSFIIRPKAERLSPHQEEPSTADDGTSESSVSSVGARGTAISFGESNSDKLSSEDDASGGEEGEEDGDDDPSRTIEMHQKPRKKRQPSRDRTRVMASGPNNVQLKAKRVLSSNTLAALNAEAGRSSDSPKRMRTDSESEMETIDSLPELSLGLSALDAMGTLQSQYPMRDESPAISSDDDDELDRALSDELKRPTKNSGDSSPVPLLTPPQSPLTVPTGDSDLVEWPSNLVVDSAMMSAAAITRPLSLLSLQKLEEEEEVRLKDAFSCPEPSSLTPLLRSIYVGID